MRFFRPHSAFTQYKGRTHRCLSALLLVLLGSFAAGQGGMFGGWRGVAVVRAQSSGPTLTIPTTLTATVASQVTVPISFAKNSNKITSTVFSIDFDESCLAFDPTDHNGDGIPDALKFTISPQFQGAVTYNPNDTQGEIDIVIADYAPPLAALSDTPALVALTFSIICTPAPGSSQFAPVRFSLHPSPSFGSTVGLDVLGSSSDGGVEIDNPALPTATLTEPAPTNTTPTNATPINTAPTATPTFVPTAPSTRTPLPTPSGTPEPTATLVGLADNGRFYLPLVMR